ncbi:MAG TPA: hypothetical protein VE338_00350 [Ktedonobacterales bacterium]|jgi:hypothetical protein|nr:hypothetical protein [Ktedonobacterales bacterium]
MTRFLDWLDESAAGLIRVAYLLAGVIAVASYFSDGNVPHAFSNALNAILPWALAGALEIHTYLTARRVRKSWQDWSAAALGSDEHERARTQMKLNLWILAALLAFSMYNQLMYLAATWTPPHTPLTPPGPWAYLIRAIITPAAFMAAAFLAPVGEGLALQVQSQAHALAVATFKVATQQWKRRLRQMQQSGQDVTGALVQLVDDPAERRVIAAIWQAMQHPQAALAPAGEAQNVPTGIERPQPFEASQRPPAAPPDGQQTGSQTRADTSIVRPTPETTPDEPPDGPGDGLPGDTRGTAAAPMSPAPTPLFMPRGRRTPKPAAIRRREKAAADALEEKRRAQAFAMLDAAPSTTANAIARQLHCRHTSAKRYLAAWQRRQSSRLA